MFGFVVHGSHLMQFARAVGDFDPVFEDVGRLAATGPDALVAPPTFLMAADTSIPPTRAARGREPRGSGRGRVTARSSPDSHGATLHVPSPVRAGDVLTAASRPAPPGEERTPRRDDDVRRDPHRLPRLRW
ncbi:hypothetical protein GS982_31310 [Rhodococcus hoagii]|nr:hypothetical protein [Prescottella equi]